MDRKSSEKRQKFLEWYNEHRDDIFDMEKEVSEYAESDVDILIRSMMQFDDMYLSLTGIRPLTNSISIAQSCNYTWRKNFMKEKTVAIIPPDGYNSGDRISKRAQEWLAWYGHQNGVRIQHGRNGKEHKVGNFKVDGLVAGTNTVLEFNGCIWHG